MKSTRKKKAPDVEVIKLANMVNSQAGSFDLLNLSEADVRQLHDGIVPDWLQNLAEWWCRENPKPSDVMPASCDPEFEMQEDLARVDTTEMSHR
jgi:hypothetical protein